jgi:hypothetical protein
LQWLLPALKKLGRQKLVKTKQTKPFRAAAGADQDFNIVALQAMLLDVLKGNRPGF